MKPNSPREEMNNDLETMGTSAVAVTAPETVFQKLSVTSDSDFQRAISVLHGSYLNSSSENGFHYSEVTLVKNDFFLKEYKTFYQQKKASNYTTEELQETYGFLLFDNENQAKLVCQLGLCVGSSTLTTLGDPTKGVYISKYSDCLHLRPWYHGKSGYIVIFNLIKGKVKAVLENYTTIYTSPSFGYDCHVAANVNKVSLKTSHFRGFELSQYYLYEFLGNSVVERPRQILPHTIVAFQYSEPKRMSTSAHKNMIDFDDEVLISPWRGQLIIQGQLICDLTLWSPHGAVIPAQLPRQLDAKYVMEVSALKKKLPESAFRKSSYLEKKVCYQGLCFSMYEVEISNKQGKKLDQLTEYIKTKELAIIKCLEDQGFLILLTSSALLWDTDFGDEHMNLYALFLFPSSLSTGRKESKCEDDISVRVVPILPTLHYALLEAKKFLSEEEVHPNVLVKHHFQQFVKLNKNSSLSSQNSFEEPEFFPFDTLSSEFKSGHRSEKFTQKTLTRLKSYFSDPSGYALEITTALDLLSGHSPSPFSVSDGICDGFSLFMPPDPEFVDSEAQMKNETEKNKDSEATGKANENILQLCPASNLRIQPKRKASMSVVMQNKKVNLCRPFSKKTGPVTTIETTVKLAKGQFPQKRKRGAEVLTAQFIQTTKLDQKNQETSVSESVPVVTNAKKVKKPETSPIKNVPRISQAMKKPPQKQRVNIVKSNQNPRMRKQLQPAKREIPSQPPIKILSNNQADDRSENTVQLGSTPVVQSDLQENCIGHFDSQALNMLADLALSSATSTTSSSIHRDLSSSSDLTQNNILLCKENSLQGTYDHEYHRLAKNQRCALHSLELSKPSYEQTDSRTNLPDSQNGKSLTQSSQTSVTQEALPKETSESSDVSNSNSSFIAIEHSYALLTTEHSKKHLQQRGTQGPTFAKNGTKGPEAGTPVGKVMPFRHQHNTPPVQKLLLDPIIKHKSRMLPSNLKEDFCHSHTVLSCDGSFKVTCKCETEYIFSLDSKYTNNPLEKTIIRALHGPWNADLPDNIEEVKLILHMWVALFYSNQNKVIPSARKVVEHSNPAKYVSINSTLDSLDFSEISEECLIVKRHSIDSSLESSWPSSSSTTGILLACTSIKASTSGLEERATLAGEDHQDATEFQSTICSSNNEVIRKRVEQELPSNIETPNIVLSSNASTQTRETSVADENENSQKVANSRAVSQNGISDPTMICGTSVNRTLEDRDDSVYEALGTKANTLQNITEHSSPRNKVTENQESLENKDGDLEYVMINLEPITFTFEKNACLPIETGFASGADKIPDSDRELIKKVSPVESLRQQSPFREIAQAQGASSANQDLQDIPSMAASVSTGAKYLCTSSVPRENLAKETGPLQKEVPIPLSTSPSNTMLIEAVSSVVSSGDQATSDEVKLPQDTFIQTRGLYSISSEEVIESSQVEEIVLTPTFTPLESRQTASAGYVPSRASKVNYSLEKETNESGLNSEKMNFESVNLAFTKETCISLGREAVSIELSDDSDIELALTISPPASPRDQAQSDEIMQIQGVPLENVELQVVAEEVIEPVNTTFPKNRKNNSSDYSSLHTALLQKPLENKEGKRDAIDPVTLVLAKESCALEIGQEVNIISNSPFDGALIEPVSPASIPDDQVPSKETPLSQDMPLQMLELHSTISKEVSKATQIQSIDLSSGEEDSALPGEKPTTTQGKPTNLAAEMALPLIDYTEQKETHLLFHRRATEDPVVQNKYDDTRFFPGNFQCCDTALNQTTLVARCEDYKTSFQELEKSENPLQQASEENKSLELTHTVLDTHKAPLCLRKLIEHRSVTEKIDSAESDLTSNSLDHKSSPFNSRKDLHGQSEYDYLHNKSLNSNSVDQSDFIQMYSPSKNPNVCISMDDASHKSSSEQLNEETFQEHGISVVNSFSSDEVVPTLHEGSINLKGTSLGLSLTSLSKGEGKPQVHQEVSVCETKDQSNETFATKESKLVCSGAYQNVANIAKTMGEEHSALAIPKPSWEAPRELVEDENAIEGIGTEKDMKSPDRNMDMNLNTEIYYESLSGESDQECFGDVKHSQLQLEDSCPLRTSNPNEVEEAPITNFDTLMNSRTVTTSSDIESWNYSHKSPVADEGSQQRSCSVGLKKGDKYVPFYIKIRDLNGTPRTYTNFTVTKKLKDTTRTLHNLKQHPSVTARCGLISSWTSTWQVTDDPTQNTLDLEYLRFAHKLKQMVKNGNSQLSTTSSPLPKESHVQTTVGVFPLTKVTEAPVIHPTSRSRSPLLVTIVHSESGDHTSDWHVKSQKHSDFNSLSSCRQDKGSQNRTIPNTERDPATSFHLHKLKYDSKLKESRSDISLILSEYAEFNKVMLNNSQRSYQANDLGGSPEKAASPKIPAFQRRMASYEHMITDLCSNLHVKLKSVIKEACKNTFLFYLVETEDSSFFIRTRNLLRKEGHKEIEPQHFCQALHRETDTLIVIIKNEDISTHVHQIPSLLRLKQFSSVMFAGVDSPGDILDGTYQELFCTGGFVVSDDKVLEAVTLVQLKEIVKILEKLNANGRWKWLLHYRESKRLKEDVRVDSVAHSKNLILKSYQSANIIEVLHYHQCDSKSSTKSEYLKCLLNLQVLHINARFAVYLTDKLSTSREIFENSGILVTDINNFAGIVQKAAPFKATYW